MGRRSKPAGRILADGTLMLDGIIGDEFDGLDSATIVEEIRGLRNADEVNVMINSPGGIVTDGLAIYHELATHPGNVVIEISGVAASMASAIAMAGDTVRIARNGHIMIHDPWNVAVGDAEDLRKAADLLDQFGTSLVNIYATKTGLDEEEIRELMAAETWMDAETALAKGFVDEIVEPVSPEAFADLDTGELTSVPAAVTRLIREGRQMARKRSTQENPAGTGVVDPPAKHAAADPPSPVAPDIEGAVQRALAADRRRAQEIHALAARVGLGREWADARIAEGLTIDQARQAAIEALADRQGREGGPVGFPAGVGITADERDKFLAGAADWLIMKAGKTRLFPQARFDAGEFRGMSLLDLARESLHRAGISTRGMSKMEIAGAALGRGPRAAQAGLGTRSDFPILLENVLHKMLLAAYEIVPDTWRLFCAEGSVSDFRPHPRLRLGTFSRLDELLESGEFKQKHFPDAEKELISAATLGNIVGLTRQAIVNDDVDGFSRLVTMLGRAAALSIEADVYGLLAENSGLGPTMQDGKSLFHADHNNIGTGSALSVDGLDGDRVVMAEQMDPEGNEFLDLRPAVLLVPIGLGGQARVINDAQFDVDAVAADSTNKFMVPNKVRGLFRNIVDTPRLSGTRRYLFADPATAPVLEVVFLDGQSSPVLEVEEGFDYDGVRWRVRFDYGTGATDFRGAVTNAGA